MTVHFLLFMVTSNVDVVDLGIGSHGARRRCGRRQHHIHESNYDFQTGKEVIEI